MLGRLEMVPFFGATANTRPSKSASKRIATWSRRCLRPNRRKARRSSTIYTILEKEIRKVIQGQNLDADALLSHPDGTCKTFVVATRVRTAGSPVLMQTYDNFPLSESFEATVWQAARATSAAPTFFRPCCHRRGSLRGWRNGIQQSCRPSAR